MFAGALAPTRSELERFTLVSKLSQEDPIGLEVLISMEGQIIRERHNKDRCDKAASRLLAGDLRWIDEIRTSNEYEIWSLLGRSIAEAFKTLTQKP